MTMRRFLITLLMMVTSPAWGGDFSLLGGRSANTAGGDDNVAWQMEFRRGVAQHLAASFTYLNEGHLPGHHRDGYGLQLWGGTGLLDGRLDIALGTGPYLFYDTTPRQTTGGEVNRHGLGLISTLSTTWQLDDHLLLQLRLNHVATGNSFDSLSTLAGLGYRFDTPRTDRGGAGEPPSSPFRNELTLFAGESNTFNTGGAHAIAAAVEYRRAFAPWLEWSASVLYEGENDLIRRGGFATQLWAAGSFLDNRLSLGAGAGPYLAIDNLIDDGGDGRDIFVLPKITMSCAYQLHPHWNTRFSWHRVLTRHDRDTDVWLWGVGYLF
jgi:hypothetical protein